MKFVSFGYEVEARVTITRDQLLNMLKCAKTHYDAACVAAGELGPRGFLWGWRTQMLDWKTLGDGDTLLPEVEVDVTTRQLDLLLKILESPSSTPGLHKSVGEVYDVLASESKRVNDLQAAQNRLKADEVLAVRCGECETQFGGPDCVTTLIRHRIAEHVRKREAAT